MAHTGLGIRMRGWGNFNRAIQADTILLERCVNWGGGLFQDLRDCHVVPIKLNFYKKL